MTITSSSRTPETTKTHNLSADNSSIRTTISLQEFFDNNSRSVVSQMAGSISRATFDTKSSLRAWGQSKNSEITCRIIPSHKVQEPQESKQSLHSRKQALKTFISLQEKRLNKEKNALEGTGDLIKNYKLKKRTIESEYIAFNLKREMSLSKKTSKQ